LLFLRIKNNGFGFDPYNPNNIVKPGCCLFLGATDPDIKGIVPVSIRGVQNFSVCLGHKNHYTFPNSRSLNLLIKQFWNTRGGSHNRSWTKCKTTEEVLRLFQYGQLESSSYPLYKLHTLKEFITRSEWDSQSKTNWV
jgi:hypothetical protein